MPMRTLLSLIATLVITAPVFAGPGHDLAASAELLRVEAQARADTFASMPGATLDPIASDDAFLIEVADFAIASARLSLDVENAGGPQDLRCIFRGMAGDAEARMVDLETEQSGADLARVYREYVRLFTQASQIGPLADDPDVEEFHGVLPICPIEDLN